MLCSDFEGRFLEYQYLSKLRLSFPTTISNIKVPYLSEDQVEIAEIENSHAASYSIDLLSGDVNETTVIGSYD